MDYYKWDVYQRRYSDCQLLCIANHCDRRPYTKSLRYIDIWLFGRQYALNRYRYLDTNIGSGYDYLQQCKFGIIHCYCHFTR